MVQEPRRRYRFNGQDLPPGSDVVSIAWDLLSTPSRPVRLSDVQIAVKVTGRDFLKDDWVVEFDSGVLEAWTETRWQEDEAPPVLQGLMGSGTPATKASPLENSPLGCFVYLIVVPALLALAVAVALQLIGVDIDPDNDDVCLGATPGNPTEHCFDPDDE